MRSAGVTAAVLAALLFSAARSFPLAHQSVRSIFAMSSSDHPVPPADIHDAEAVAPLIRIPAPPSDGQSPPSDICNELVSAFQNSGFLRITSPFLPLSLQKRAIEAATAHLVSTPAADDDEASAASAPCARPEVVTHPTDPKSYSMLTSKEEAASISPILAEYTEALEKTKMLVLRCLAIGLNLPSDYFCTLHSENNSSLRLLRYPATSAGTGNRCKEHSDYGSITLLLTDGVSGLEAYHEGSWVPVPHEEGCLVVNAGSLLESWTNGKIPATLHRVAGPTSENSRSPKDLLRDAVTRDRTSLAFFADPNTGVKTALQADKESDGDGEKVAQMSVTEYIRWRSGGADGDAKRSGLAFTSDEEDRLQSSRRDTGKKPRVE